MKKKATAQQLENLKKGFEALKEKRKKNAEKEDAEVVAEAVAVAPVTEVVAPAVAPVVEPVTEAVAVKVVKQRKPKKPAFNPDEFKTSLLNELRSQPPTIEERIIEKPVERIVYKERVLTGSEILNRLFNFS